MYHRNKSLQILQNESICDNFDEKFCQAVIYELNNPRQHKTSSKLIKIVRFSVLICMISLLTHICARASLIIGDSAIEIQEFDGSASPDPNPSANGGQQAAQQLHPQDDHIQPQQQQQTFVPIESEIVKSHPSIIFGTANDAPTASSIKQSDADKATSFAPYETEAQVHNRPQQGTDFKDTPDPSNNARLLSRPLPPLAATNELSSPSIGSEQSNLYDIADVYTPGSLREVDVKTVNDDKTITGKVVDFELTPAGGHNKAKIKKKKKKHEEHQAEKEFKKWDAKKKAEKKAIEKKEQQHMKKKKEEGKKAKKKWGHEEHGQKKAGKFKKKKWGKKMKKGDGIKKGKKGKKFLKDKGHKNTGFKTVYHKEEWGKSSKWHDIKREKKWDEKAKKWKKKWKKEKGKKYKGEHMKKFEKKKKEGKKYKKAKKEKFKKFKKEKFEKGRLKKMEEHKKKKEEGAKKMKKAMEKKKKLKKP